MSKKCKTCDKEAKFRCYCDAEVYYCGEQCSMDDESHFSDVQHMSWSIDNGQSIDAHRLPSRCKNQLHMQFMMQKLVDYTYNLVVAVLSNDNIEETFFKRLLDDQGNIAQLIGELTKSKSAEADIRPLLEENIQLTYHLVLAVKTRSGMKSVLSEQRENTEAIARTLSGMTRKLRYDTLNKAFQDHNSNIYSLILSVNSKGKSATVNQLDSARDHMIMVGMVLVKGLKKYRM